ncbi:hypothetical protein LAZ67_9000653 [Cordylochernes scorpioides]|uniref:Histone-lysine N-methyltransferase SETMAR n=1 Tax=Cordylochernes scorpioides TaxID=51811 RepID=A0ABY6KSL9_9ARAC|nr:hypothetical protein LAZ67_9000653 [Cordylochernes scorpioides]
MYEELVSHPPYSPDIAPSDFHLFPELKKNLGGTRFQDDDEFPIFRFEEIEMPHKCAKQIEGSLLPSIFRILVQNFKGLRVHQLWIKILWCNWQGRSEFTSHEKLSRAATVLQRGRSILQESKRWVLIFLEDQLSNFHTCFCHPIALRESRT